MVNRLSEEMRVSYISVQDISKHWGPTKAVDSVSFEADTASLLVLLGPSGCGKSTTLRLIAGLEQVSTGRILIGGKDVTDLPPARRQISMVFQSYALFPHLTVAENILFGLKVRRVPKAERMRRLARVTSLLGLDRLLARKPSQLSGGQQQRVALGRAIIAETPVCLMDEPLSNLDAQLRAEMRREIRSLQQTLGITMVYVTHDQTEAMSMADQVILMRDGRVEQAAPPDILYARPQTIFAARFIGTPPMNILSLNSGTESDVARDAAGVSLRMSGDLLLGVRPEDVTIGNRGAAARVSNVEFLGADTVVACTVGNQSIIARLPGKARLEPGVAVNLAWHPENMHIFDAKSGQRRDDVLTLASDNSISSAQNCFV
jgi:sn-glycerol 3-phosphate transport system ATP-binding protein